MVVRSAVHWHAVMRLPKEHVMKSKPDWIRAASP